MSGDGKLFQKRIFLFNFNLKHCLVKLGELRTELGSEKDAKRRIALKRVLATLSQDVDVAALTPELLYCLASSQPDVQKLAFLILSTLQHHRRTSSSKSLPYELPQGAHALFQRWVTSRDASDRVYAIRYLGYLDIKRFLEIYKGPLVCALSDKDPHVRKTACIGVAKLVAYHHTHSHTQQHPTQSGFNTVLSALMQLLSDAAPVVHLFFLALSVYRI